MKILANHTFVYAQLGIVDHRWWTFPSLKYGHHQQREGFQPVLEQQHHGGNMNTAIPEAMRRYHNDQSEYHFNNHWANEVPMERKLYNY